MELYVPFLFDAARFLFRFGSIKLEDPVYGYTVPPKRRTARKRTFWHMRTTKTQNSLRICAVWPESLLSVLGNFASLAIQNAPSEDSDQSARMRRLIWIFAWRTCPKVRFQTLRFRSMDTLETNTMRPTRNIYTKNSLLAIHTGRATPDAQALYLESTYRTPRTLDRFLAVSHRHLYISLYGSLTLWKIH